MIKSLITRITLFFVTPRKGETYLGDPIRFVVSRQMEYILFGLKNKLGGVIWHPIPSFGCYRIKITNSSMYGYYVCDAEVLCEDAFGVKGKEWRKRCQPKRISKELFNSMIVYGYLRKEQNV